MHSHRITSDTANGRQHDNVICVYPSKPPCERPPFSVRTPKFWHLEHLDPTKPSTSCYRGCRTLFRILVFHAPKARRGWYITCSLRKTVGYSHLALFGFVANMGGNMIVYPELWVEWAFWCCSHTKYPWPGNTHLHASEDRGLTAISRLMRDPYGDVYKRLHSLQIHIVARTEWSVGDGEQTCANPAVQRVFHWAIESVFSQYHLVPDDPTPFTKNTRIDCTVLDGGPPQVCKGSQPYVAPQDHVPHARVQEEGSVPNTRFVSDHADDEIDAVTTGSYPNRNLSAQPIPLNRDHLGPVSVIPENQPVPLFFDANITFRWTVQTA